MTPLFADVRCLFRMGQRQTVFTQVPNMAETQVCTLSPQREQPQALWVLDSQTVATHAS